MRPPSYDGDDPDGVRHAGLYLKDALEIPRRADISSDITSRSTFRASAKPPAVTPI